MDMIQEWQVLLIPAAVTIITQLIKVVLDTHKQGFQWSHFNSYGGMPSAHTAGFVSLPMMVGLVDGFATSTFAIAAMVGVVIIRDAVGIRWALGFHGKVLNHVLKNLPPKERKEFPQKLRDRFGHTYAEATVGACLSITLTALLYIAVN